MGLRIHTNLFALPTTRHLAQTAEEMRASVQRLSSGLRIVSGADDPSGLKMSERMRAGIRSTKGAGRNIEQGIAVARLAEAVLAEMNAQLARAKEIALQVATGTVAKQDLAALGTEFDQVVGALTQIAQTTTFNGIHLLSSERTIDIQAGIDAGETIPIQLVDARNVGESLGQIDLLGQDGGDKAMTLADRMIEFVSRVRGKFGIVENRLESALRSSQHAHDSLQVSESRIRDADLAFEAAELFRLRTAQALGIGVHRVASFNPGQIVYYTG